MGHDGPISRTNGYVSMLENVQSTVGDRIKYVADELSCTYTGLAALIDIPYRTLQNYLSNEREPTAISLAKFHDKACVNINWLITGEGAPFLSDFIDQNIFDKLVITLLNEIIDVVVRKRTSSFNDQDTYKLVSYLMRNKRLGVGDAIRFIAKEAGYQSLYEMTMEDLIVSEDIIRRRALPQRRRKKGVVSNKEALSKDE